jgi:hypothetical protein
MKTTRIRTRRAHRRAPSSKAALPLALALCFPAGEALAQVACAPGTFSGTGNEPCTPAPAGSFVDAIGATAPTACSLGRFQPLTGSTSCNFAPAGSFVAVTGAVAATACVAGTFQPATGQSSCASATAGFFVGASGSTTQAPCSPGTYQPLAGQSSCLQAPAGSFVSSVAATAPTACAVGRFQPLAGSTSCSAAPAGSFVAVTGATTASSCAAGTYQPLTGQSSCTPAAAGSFVGNAGATTPLQCSPGTFTATSGQSACALAPAGYFVSGSGATAAAACALGTFQSLSGSVACLPASPGTFVGITGATTASSCAAGTYQPGIGATACLPAAAGSFVGNAGATAPLQCAPGTFTATSGQSACTPAPAGFFVSGSGATSAAACALGTFQSLPGSVACVPASAGTFVGVTGATAASSCAVGTFQPATGTTACIPSPAGSFVGVTGQTASSLCAPGSFQPLDGAAACLPAEAGYFVPTAGATSQTACAAGTTSSPGATACVPVTYTLEVTKTGFGAGLVTSDPPGIDCGPTCSSSYGAGIPVSLTAAPAPGSLFAGWSGACAGTAQCVVAMTGPFTVGAAFELDPAGDSDGDGIPNAVETVEGRDPLVKDNDLFSPGPASARLFAMQQYRDFLGREGDEPGIQGWTGLVDGGTHTRPQVIDAFVGSPEFAGFVAPVVRLYFATFLRVPDYAGLVANAALVRNGTVTPAQLADFFAASPEFAATYGALDDTQFVTLLYGNVLGRAPDQAGLDGWVALLQGGMSRGQVLLGFSESAEYQAAMAHEVLVTMMYAGMLRRTPEPAGFNGWVQFLDDATYTREQVINGFFLSTEYRARFLP